MYRSFLMALVGVFALGTVAMASDTIVLKAGHSANVNEPYHIGLQAFADSVSAKTNDKVKVEIFPNCVLGSEPEMIEGLLLGNLDITVPSNGVLTNFIPSMRIFEVPYLFDSREHMYKVVDGEVGQHLSDAMSSKGFRKLAFYEAGIRHIMTAKKPVNSLEDLKNMKIRTMEIPAHVASFNAFGAKATPLAYGELYSALQSGVVDGAEAANSNYYAKQFHRVAPYWAQVGWTMLVADLIMSESRFASLPADVQQAVLEAAQESAVIERAAYAKTDENLLEQLQAEGVTVTYPDVAPFRAAAESVYKSVINDKETKGMLEIIRSTK